MPTEEPIYDLLLLLSTSAPEERRAKVMQEVETAISSSGGSMERNADWGTRGLAYQIAHQGDAEYHLIQFRGPSELLESLSHSLRIADDVLRFRIIKVIPGTPPASDSPPPVIAMSGTPSGQGRRESEAPPREPEAPPPVSEAPPASEAPPPASEAPSPSESAEGEEGEAQPSEAASESPA